MSSSEPIPGLRRQYHFRASPRGLLAWDVHRLIRLAEGLPVQAVPLSDIREIDEPYWFGGGSDVATCRRVAKHAQLIQEADLAYPILLCHEGRIMDGMHRVLKALNEDSPTVQAKQFLEPIEPDHVGCDPQSLPDD
ncbi:MAG: hypothetical protein AAGF84_08275 [Planctomycetota bacterium]